MINRKALSESRSQDFIEECGFEDEPMLEPFRIPSTYVTACMLPGIYSLNLYDNDGDGWTGAVLSGTVYDSSLIGVRVCQFFIHHVSMSRTCLLRLM